MTHALKCWPEYYKAIKDGTKPFDLRKEDRPYKEGDTILMQEFEPKEEKYTGEEISLSITYILKGVPKFGLKDGFCILGIKEKE